MWRRALEATAAVILVGATACGSTSEPADGPPWGLDAVNLPADATSVEAVFAAMPDEVGGHARLVSDVGVADYEGDAVVSATPLGNDPAGGDVRGFLQHLSDAGKVGEIEVETEQLDGPLAYMVFNTTGDGRPVWLIAWGAPDAPYMFGVKAESQEDRTALVRAFVDAAS